MQQDWLAFHFQAPLWSMLLLTLAGARQRRGSARSTPAPQGQKA